MSPIELLDGSEVVDREMATACLAGLWLYHDFLDESHRLSQDIATVSGSFWHGIMHRREPDYGNAKYWFHRVGVHPVYDGLLTAARAVAGSEPAAESDSAAHRLLANHRWDAAAFVDLCEAAATGRNSLENLCRRIQHCEWQLLFDYCYRGAIGALRSDP